jgi:hypothetical protein
MEEGGVLNPIPTGVLGAVLAGVRKGDCCGEFRGVKKFMALFCERLGTQKYQN